MSRIVIVMLIYHRHKHTDRINLVGSYQIINVLPVRHEHYPSCANDKRQNAG
jgi:hypothetical protein